MQVLFHRGDREGETIMPLKTYDIVLSSPFSNYDFFAHKMRELCGQMDSPSSSRMMSGCTSSWASCARKTCRARHAGPHRQPDRPHRRVHPVGLRGYQAGGTVIDDPELTAFSAHKAKLHDLLVQHHVPVPDTIMVPREQIGTYRITREIRDRLGVPFVVKPAWGTPAWASSSTPPPSTT